MVHHWIWHNAEMYFLTFCNYSSVLSENSFFKMWGIYWDLREQYLVKICYGKVNMSIYNL